MAFAPRIFLSIAALLIQMLALAQFTRAEASTSAAPLRVLTTIKPLRLIAIAVGGDAIRADALLDPQFSPHDYQLRPSDRAKLHEADVIFWVGPRLEVFLQPPLATLSQRTTVIALQDADEDPHIWMDPIAAIQIAKRMAATFAALRPDLRHVFAANSDKLEAALLHQDAEDRAQLKQSSALRGFMVSHDAYSRFERRYGFAHRAALTNAADMPPSAKSLAAIERELDAGAIACIWRQPQESKLYERLIAGRNLRTATIDAMAAQTAITSDGILQFYRRLWDAAMACVAN